MATLNIRNVPEDLYKSLRKNAKSHHRSLNQETIVALERALYGERVNREEILQFAREVREKTKGYHLTEKELFKTKNEGRE